MKIRTLLLLPLLAATLWAQGFSSRLFHLVRLDYLVEDHADISFAKPKEIRLPNYDFEMLRAGIEGEVTLSFHVNAEGRTFDLKTLGSSQKEFETAAIAAVEAWTFIPLGEAAKTTSGLITCKFSFLSDR